MLQREVEIINKLGLHARASAQLTQVAARSKANVWLGRSQFTADPAFDGQIDDLRIYNSALTAGQITTIYTSR